MDWNLNSIPVISESAILNVNTPLSEKPIIIQQPEDLKLYKSESAIFTVKANGSKPLRYQWFKSNKIIKGATESSYTINSVKGSDAGKYKVFISNKHGSVFSEEASLTLKKW